MLVNMTLIAECYKMQNKQLGYGKTLVPCTVIARMLAQTQAGRDLFLLRPIARFAEQCVKSNFERTQNPRTIRSKPSKQDVTLKCPKFECVFELKSGIRAVEINLGKGTLKPKYDKQ